MLSSIIFNILGGQNIGSIFWVWELLILSVHLLHSHLLQPELHTQSNATSTSPLAPRTEVRGPQSPQSYPGTNKNRWNPCLVKWLLVASVVILDVILKNPKMKLMNMFQRKFGSPFSPTPPRWCLVLQLQTSAILLRSQQHCHPGTSPSCCVSKKAAASMSNPNMQRFHQISIHYWNICEMREITSSPKSTIDELTQTKTESKASEANIVK